MVLTPYESPEGIRGDSARVGSSGRTLGKLPAAATQIDGDEYGIPQGLPVKTLLVARVAADVRSSLAPLENLYGAQDF